MMTRPSADDVTAPDAQIAEQRGTATRRRSVELLDRVLSSNAVTIEEVADILMVRPASVLEYRSGRLLMPVEVQLLLIALTIERVPAHRRLAHQLRSQLKAAIAYASGETTTHHEGPHKWPR